MGSSFLFPLFLDMPSWHPLYMPCVLWYAVHLVLIHKVLLFAYQKKKKKELKGLIIFQNKIPR